MFIGTLAGQSIMITPTAFTATVATYVHILVPSHDPSGIQSVANAAIIVNIINGTTDSKVWKIAPVDEWGYC